MPFLSSMLSHRFIIIKRTRCRFGYRLFWLDKPINATQWSGAALTVLAIYLGSLKSGKPLATSLDESCKIQPLYFFSLIMNKFAHALSTALDRCIATKEISERGNNVGLCIAKRPVFEHDSRLAVFLAVKKATNTPITPTTSPFSASTNHTKHPRSAKPFSKKAQGHGNGQNTAFPQFTTGNPKIKQGINTS